MTTPLLTVIVRVLAVIIIVVYIFYYNQSKKKKALKEKLEQNKNSQLDAELARNRKIEVVKKPLESIIKEKLEENRNSELDSELERKRKIEEVKKRLESIEKEKFEQIKIRGQDVEFEKKRKIEEIKKRLESIEKEKLEQNKFSEQDVKLESKVKIKEVKNRIKSVDENQLKQNKTSKKDVKLESKVKIKEVKNRIKSVDENQLKQNKTSKKDVEVQKIKKNEVSHKSNALNEIKIDEIKQQFHNRFIIYSNDYLKKDIIAFYHSDYNSGGSWRIDGTIENMIWTLKNDSSPFPLRLPSAKRRLENILSTDLPKILDSTNFTNLTVCVVPRAKNDSYYRTDQLYFRQIINDVVNKLNGFHNGVFYIKRLINTQTTHLRGDRGGDGRLPYIGITKKTCTISNEVQNKDILLIDDIYTKGVNIDEDALQALLDSGAKSVIFYAIGKTVSRF